MSDQGTVVVGEDEVGGSLSPQLQEKHEQTVEAAARKKGWKPLEELPEEFDQEDWVPAKEFLGRQKLFDKIGDLKSDLYRQRQKFEGDMKNISAYISQIKELEYKRAVEDLKVQRKLAMQDGNADAVEAVEQKLDQVKEEHSKATQERSQQAQRTDGTPSPEFQQWHSENNWFNKDLEMTQDAVAIGTGHAAANPNLSQKQVLDYVTTKIKKMYPDKFEAPRQRQEAVEVETGNGGSRPVQSTAKGKKGLTVADLNDDQRKIMKAIVQRGALKEKAAKNKVSQEQQYLLDLAEVQGLR